MAFTLRNSFCSVKLRFRLLIKRNFELLLARKLILNSKCSLCVFWPDQPLGDRAFFCLLCFLPSLLAIFSFLYLLPSFFFCAKYCQFGQISILFHIGQAVVFQGGQFISCAVNCLPVGWFAGYSCHAIDRSPCFYQAFFSPCGGDQFIGYGFYQ